MPFDRKGREKKGWKAFQIDYDYVFSVSDRVCSYCLSDQDVAALLAMTEYLSWPTRWVKAEGDIDRDFIDAFTDRLERRLMSGCCDDNLPIQYRYTSDGVLQRSLNGGGNWTDAPEYDPRVYSTQFPPMGGADGDDKKCIAATGAVVLIKEQVGDQLTDDMSRYTLTQLVTDWIKTYISTSNPLQALLTVIANQIFALVIAALRPALTDTVYDIMKCIFYNHVAEDASVNDAQWQAIRDDITSQIGGIAGIFLEHLIYLLGTTGTTNLIRAGGATEGDCSGCDVTCDVDLWDIFSGSETYGVIVERGSNYIIADLSFAPATAGEYFLRMKTISTDTCCKITNYDIISGGTINISAYALCGTTQDGTTTNTLSTSTGSGEDDINLFAIGSTGACQVKIYFA